MKKFTIPVATLIHIANKGYKVSNIVEKICLLIMLIGAAMLINDYYQSKEPTNNIPIPQQQR